MNLVIDSGNTLTKAAIFDKGALTAIHHIKNIDKTFFDQLLENNQISRTIIASVSQPAEEIEKWIKKTDMDILIASHKLKFPFTIAYHTPHTLGIDRVAAVAGGAAQFPGENLLIVDAGTAITYEIYSSGATYLGGNIAPGMNMRFKALHQLTSRLPLTSSDSYISEYGRSTSEAIASGVVQGMLNEITGYQQLMNEQFGNFRTIITGGDAEFFAAKLKNPIFVNLNLVLNGLNHILEYNA